MSRTTVLVRTAAAAVIVVALTACTGDATPDATATAGSEQTSGPADVTSPADGDTPAATDDETEPGAEPDDDPDDDPATTEQPAPPDAVTTAPRVEESGTPGDLTAVEVGADGDVDTVAFQFEGDGLPPYEIEYRDVLMRGDDDPVLLAGDGVLVVTFSDATPGAGGVTGEDVVTNEEFDQDVVRQVVLAKNLGGTVVYGLGVAEEVPFSVDEDREDGRLTVELHRP